MKSSIRDLVEGIVSCGSLNPYTTPQDAEHLLGILEERYRGMRETYEQRYGKPPDFTVLEKPRELKSNFSDRDLTYAILTDILKRHPIPERAEIKISYQERRALKEMSRYLWSIAVVRHHIDICNLEREIPFADPSTLNFVLRGQQA